MFKNEKYSLAKVEFEKAEQLALSNNFDSKQAISGIKACQKELDNLKKIQSKKNQIESITSEDYSSDRNLPMVIIDLEGDMVSIPSGKFIMGCIDENGNYCKEDEKHRREVKVNSFKIGKYEVTQEEWRAVMGIDPPELKNKECDRCPVENVSWNDIQYFIEKLNQMTRKKYRLPTEAEWEFAARGGEKFRFAGSNDIDRVGWYSGNSRSDTYIVGAKVSNEYRLYDMSGNVWEWCQDIYHKSYEGAPIDGKSNELNGSNRVVRGGCSGSDAKYCRVSCRGNFSPEVYSKFIGFRLALSQ